MASSSFAILVYSAIENGFIRWQVIVSWLNADGNQNVPLAQFPRQI